jgi:hypothetical protein
MIGFGAGAADLRAQMAREHASTEALTDASRRITTSAADEWALVTNPPKKEKENSSPRSKTSAPSSSGGQGEHDERGEVGRKLLAVSEVMEMPEAQEAALSEEEVIALRLYTGVCVRGYVWVFCVCVSVE